MKKLPKVSVIVPIYNVAKYLDRSIKSILNQTLNDIEIILIDDGSTDESLSICNNYKKKDSRIKVYSKKNGGVSSARNLGIKKAKGTYLAFVDPDDWIENEMYESLYFLSEKKETDITICDYMVEQRGEKSKKKINYEKDTFDRSDIMKYLIPNMIGQESFKGTGSNIMGSVCRLIVRREFILNNNVKFREDISLMEDLIFCIVIFMQVEKISYVKSSYYHYMKNENSALSSYRENTIFERIKVNEILNKIFKSHGVKNLYEKRMRYRYMKMAIISISYETRKGNKKSFVEKVKTIKKICKNSHLKKCIKETDIKQYNKKTVFLFMLIKYELSTVLYLYYKLSK